MKPFRIDALKMKEEIQERIAEENRGLSPREIREHTHKKLMKSDSPSARMYQREIAKRAAAVSENPAPYNAPTKES